MQDTVKAVKKISQIRKKREGNRLAKTTQAIHRVYFGGLCQNNNLCINLI